MREGLHLRGSTCRTPPARLVRLLPVLVYLFHDDDDGDDDDDSDDDEVNEDDGDGKDDDDGGGGAPPTQGVDVSSVVALPLVFNLLLL